MGIRFDAGYRRPYATLVANYPDEDVYPPDSFRTEWGPIFHRGRLDGSARILVIGQDPATHETICRRILVGEAGQRVQGLLAKLGITRSYVLINTFLYSVYGQGGGARHIDDADITAYRNRWLDTLSRRNELEAILSLGTLADRAYEAWKETPTGAELRCGVRQRHPPDVPGVGQRLGQHDQGRSDATALRFVERSSHVVAADRHLRRGAAAGALRRDDHQGRSRDDPVGGPAGRAAGVDALARRLGVAHRRRRPDETGDDHRGRPSRRSYLAGEQGGAVGAVAARRSIVRRCPTWCSVRCCATSARRRRRSGSRPTRRARSRCSGIAHRRSRCTTTTTPW